MAIDKEKIIEFIGKFLDFQSRLFKSEAVRIGGGVFFAIILVISLLPFLFDNSALKFKIAQKVSQISGANFAIHGNVKVAFLPSPSITIEDAVLQNYQPAAANSAPEKIYNLYVKSLHIKFPIFKFSSAVFAKEITFEDVILESYEANNQPVGRNDKFTETMAQFANNAPEKENGLGSGISAKLFPISDMSVAQFSIANAPDIIIKNGETAFYDNFGQKKEVKLINATIETSKDKISSKGNFTSEKIISNFKFLAKFNSQASKPQSFLELSSSAGVISIKGNFTSENIGIFASDFNGKIEAEILELKSFYKSYIGGDSVVANKLKYNAKPVKISADIVNKSKEISISKLLINSDLANGSGDIELDLADKIPLIDIDLNLENLDLDSIWSGDSVTLAANANNQNIDQNQSNDEAEVLPQDTKNAPTQIIEQSKLVGVASAPTQENQIIVVDKKDSGKIRPLNFDITNKIRDIDLTAEIHVKNVKYFDGEIKDVDLYLTISKKGEILILPLIFKIPGDGVLRLNGVLYNSTEIPKFVGKFDVRGKSLKDIFKWLKIESQNLKFDSLAEYSLFSDVLLLPNSIALNNFYMNLGNDSSEFLGELKVDNSSKVASIISRFAVSSINLDDYFLVSGQNAYFAPGLLLKKLLWLNNISASNDLTFSFDKLIYKGETFSNQSLKLRFGRGYLEINDLILQSEKTNLKADLSVDISGQVPKFEIKVAADNFHYESMKQSDLKRSELITENKDSKSADNAVTVSKKIINQSFFDQLFALPSLEGFDGIISLNFVNLTVDDDVIRNFKLAGNVKDGNLDVPEFTCDIYDGKFSYKGLVGIKTNKTINGNLSFSNASLQPLLSDLVGIKNVSGVANISANITAVGSQRSEFIKQISSEIKFNANAPTVEGYGLNDLVKKMFAPQIYHEELQNPEAILINSQAKTIFKQANGTIQITKGNEGKLRINVTAPAVNGILSGALNIENNTIDALFNAIFLTGNRQKQMPINVATNLKGDMSAISQSTNLDQAKQYLGLMKPQNPAAVPATTQPASTQ